MAVQRPHLQGFMGAGEAKASLQQTSSKWVDNQLNRLISSRVGLTGLLLVFQLLSWQTQGQSIRITPLASTPKTTNAFTPPEQKGYWNIDIVGDFYLPASKSMTFNGAGRNLHVDQDWEKLFRRGFTALDRTRMTYDEQRIPIYNEKPAGWKSR